MNRSIYSIAGIALALGSFAAITQSCNNTKADKTADKISFTNIKTNTTYRLIGSAADYETEKDLSFDCSANILMPSEIYGHDITALNDSILKTAFDSAGSDHAGIIREAFKKATADLGYQIADTTVADNAFDGYYTAIGSIANLSSKILSYQISVSTYMPRAAHGMYGTYYVNYDINSGKVFSLADIFTPQGIEKLPAIIRDEATAMQGSIGQTQIEAIPSGGNFYINGDSDIVFVYQPYEVASYAQGEIIIPIAAYVLSDNFTPYGKKLLMDVD